MFVNKNLDEITQDDMRKNIDSLQTILQKVTELNRKNDLLRAKYENDRKYARIHKRIIENDVVSERESQIYESLNEIKKQADEKVLINERILDNESYFTQMMTPIVIDGFESKKVKLDAESAKFINNYVVKEYVNEYRGGHLW